MAYKEIELSVGESITINNSKTVSLTDTYGEQACFEVSSDEGDCPETHSQSHYPILMIDRK